MKETVIRKVSNLVTMFLDARYKKVIPLSHILFAQDTFLDDSILELKIYAKRKYGLLGWSNSTWK